MERIKAGLNYFLNVPGHLYEVEGQLLQQLAAGRRVLDIGTHHGRAAAAMAATAKHVTTIDWFKGDSMIGAPDVDVVKELIFPLENVTCLFGNWVDFMLSKLTLFKPGDYDMIFYDAAHRPPEPYEKDFLAMVDGFSGTIALHDYKPKLEEYGLAVAAMEDFAKKTGRALLGPVAGSSIVWFEDVG
jgi:predicted O-methyltransferase YrrM